jgi:hypothetical protein
MDPFSLQQKHIRETVEDLLEKYREDPYMSAKLHNYICVQLSTLLENNKRRHEESQQRIAGLTMEQDEFMERFLNAHLYFYVSTTERFASYDGVQYKIVSEDTVLHHILTTITSEKQLMDWKQRTKVYIMKRIKDNALLKSVPESETIQRVLDYICPALFETKHDAKYFLTIVGDTLFRKNNELVHFIQPRAKAFLREITNSSLYIFGVNSAQTFKYKYYDHNYSQCRLVKINDSVENENIWGNILRNVALDMLCVSAHYSIRYGSSDDYVSRYSNSAILENYAFFLRNSSQEQLVSRFIDEYLQVSLNGTTQYIGVAMSPSSTPPNASNLLLSLATSPSVPIYEEKSSMVIHRAHTFPASSLLPHSGVLTISWKNMLYLWRHFLENQKLPTVIFQQNLKTILTQKLCENYKEEGDIFIGVSSRFMPAIKSFMYFWETTISYEENGEYEIDELCSIYKRWLSACVSKENTLSYEDKSFTRHFYSREGVVTNSLTEKQMMDLIRYYYPATEIEKDKYVYNIRCSLWDKQMDVQVALSQMKDDLRSKLSETDAPQIYATTVYDAYIWYCKYYSDMPNETVSLVNNDSKSHHINGERTSIVSKLYFEKYVSNMLSEYVVDDKYILREWAYSDLV